MEPQTGLVDDFDGQPLPEGTEPTELTLEGKTYRILLSPQSRDRLLEVLKPFIDEAEVEGHTGRMNNMRFMDTGKPS